MPDDAVDLRAWDRDAAAESRDRDGERRDALARQRPRGADDGLDRAAAAHDRAAARRDRDEAASDRRRAAEDRRSAERDELTGALQRAPGRAAIGQEIDRAGREGGQLVVAFLDIDNLKRRNDEGGHADGDALIRAVGEALRSGLRTYDIVVRHGGDEFVCALPGATVDDASSRFAEVRKALEIVRPRDAFSIGVAQWRAGDHLDDVIGRADRDLYAERGTKRRV